MSKKIVKKNKITILWNYKFISSYNIMQHHASSYRCAAYENQMRNKKWEMRNIFVQKRKCLCDGTPSLAVLVRYTHHFGDHYWMILGKNLGMTPPYIGIGQYTSIYGYYLNNHIWGTISGVNPTTRQLLIYLSTLKYLTIRSNLNPMCISDQYCNLFSGKQLPLCGYNINNII